MKKRAPVAGTTKADKRLVQRMDVVTERKPGPTPDDDVRAALAEAAAKVKPLVQREERGELVTAELLNARIGSR